MKLHHILFVTLILSYITGCNSSVENKLLHAESLISENPDSATNILQEIPVSTLYAPESKALFNLLKYEISYKNYIQETDDSIINQVVQFYIEKDDKRRLMRALFMLSITQYYNSDYHQSISSAFEAENRAKELNDIKYLAKINEHIADLYATNHNHTEALHHGIIATNLYNLAGMSRHKTFAEVETAKDLHNLGEYERCHHMFDSILSSIPPCDTILFAFTHRGRIRTELALGNLYEAKKSIDTLTCLNESMVTPYVRFAAIDLAIAEKDTDLARELIDNEISLNADSDSTGLIQLALYNLNKANGNNAKALEHFERAMKIQNELIQEILSQSLLKVHRDYYAKSALEERMRAERNFFILISVMLIFSIIILYFYFYHRKKIIIKKCEIEQKINQIRELFTTLSERDNSISAIYKEIEYKELKIKELNSLLEKKQIDLCHSNQEIIEFRNRIDSLYRHQFDTLNKLCNEYFSKKDANTIIKTTMIKEVESLILSLRNPKTLQELTSSLNEYHDGIIDLLRECFPDMKKVDITFLTLLFAGLSSKAICIICDLSMGNYYNKRQRLKAKLETLKSPIKERFLALYP